uniref:Uncharacterized protein n=1 Tax=Mantoniella antarctica TaxID=81844 RepID=A0A7S0XGY7_9CHLO|mmetsp:Transcript_6576/g.16339  ORF Transcript_6576/g.16339 Transcript_6576/m.16339 type:complete len:166 (+) Transcript_6576:275-772(+)
MHAYSYTFNSHIVRGAAIIEALTASTRQQDLADAFDWFQSNFSNVGQVGQDQAENQFRYMELRFRSFHGITTTLGEVPVPSRAINVEVAYMMMRSLNLEFDVKLGGLVGAAHLNGRVGVIRGDARPAGKLGERWETLLDDDALVSVKSANFVHIRKGEYRRVSQP